MLEYFRGKLDELLGSLLNPIWERILRSPWWLRLLVLIVLAPIAYGLYAPASVRNAWDLCSAVVRVARAPQGRVPVSAQIRNQVAEVARRLEATLEGDVASPASSDVTPWVISQETLASHGLNRHLDSGKVVGYVRSHVDPACACWREIPDNPGRPPAIFVSGWVFSALARVGEPASSSEIGYVLQQQKPNGWWPVYSVRDDSPFASSYSTAWSLLGLHEQLSGPLRNDPAAADARAAIQKGSSWLLARRQRGSRWKDYPLLPNGVVSDSVSGVALHALHWTAQDRIGEIDAEWLDALPEKVPSVRDADHSYIWYSSTANDDTVLILQPWLLVGTVDAYGSGSLLQRARALLWIERTLTQPGLARADTIVENWWRAEVLYGLQYVLERSGPAGAAG
jgi:hypothetical protein